MTIDKLHQIGKNIKFHSKFDSPIGKVYLETVKHFPEYELAVEFINAPINVQFVALFEEWNIEQLKKHLSAV